MEACGKEGAEADHGVETIGVGQGTDQLIKTM